MAETQEVVDTPKAGPAMAALGISPASQPSPVPQVNGTGAPVTQQQGSTPDPIDAVVLPHIRQAEGTGQSPWLLYGGASFTPGKDHPANAGWEGGVGPDGRETHAAGPYMWQPGTWQQEKQIFAQRGVNLDFNNPQHQDLAAKDLAERTYRQNTGRDLRADAQAGNVDYSALSGQWQGLQVGGRGWANSMSPALQERARALEAEGSRLRDEYHSDANELMRIAGEAPSGSKERDQAISKLRDREQRYIERYEEISSHPPVMKPVDALQNFGSSATLIALLGGLFSRRHMTTALGAAGAAMQAINQNKYDEFQRAYKTWDQASTTALNMVKLHNEQIRELIDDKKTSVDEKNTNLRTLFEALGMQRQADQMSLGVSERVFAEQAGLERSYMSAKQSQISLKQSVASGLEAKYIAEGLSPPDARERAYREAGITGTASSFAKNQAAQTFSDEIQQKTGKTPTYQDWVKFSQDNKGAATGQLSGDAVKMLAKQYEMGDPGVITSLPRGGPGRIQVENQVAEDLRGMDNAAAGIVMNRLRMAEAKAAASTAGRITMQTDLYATEAVGAGKLVVDASKLFPRTEYPKVNQALEAVARNTGDPNIIRLGVSINSLFNVYGKMSNPTGTGIHDADKERLSKQLDEALAQGQIEAGVDQIIKEGENVAASALKAQQQVLAGLAPQIPGATQAQPPAPQSTGRLPEGVPSGSKQIGTSGGKPVWQAPDGSYYQEH